MMELLVNKNKLRTIIDSFNNDKFTVEDKLIENDEWGYFIISEFNIRTFGSFYKSAVCKIEPENNDKCKLTIRYMHTLFLQSDILSRINKKVEIRIYNRIKRIESDNID